MQGLIARAAADISKARYAIALTGAGISTESGIHDFRGPDGIWTKNPISLFSIEVEDPVSVGRRRL